MLIPIFALVSGLGGSFAGCAAPQAPFTLTSPVFVDRGIIPTDYSPYSGDAYKKSPPLDWSTAPKGTKSFALAMVDLDVPWEKIQVPAGSFPGDLLTHWMVYDIPTSMTSLDGAISPGKALGENLPKGVKELYNDCARFGGDYVAYGVGYVGPMPPEGDYAHAYVLTLYALDIENLTGLTPGTLDKPGSSYGEFTRAMAGHVLATASLTGYYGKPGK